MTDLELDRIITLKRAAELMGVHVNTVRNNYRDKFVWLSPRRCGLRLRDALRLDGKCPKCGWNPNQHGLAACSNQPCPMGFKTWDELGKRRVSGKSGIR